MRAECCIKMHKTLVYLEFTIQFAKNILRNRQAMSMTGCILFFFAPLKKKQKTPEN